MAVSAQDSIWESSNPFSVLEPWVFFLGIWVSERQLWMAPRSWKWWRQLPVLYGCVSWYIIVCYLLLPLFTSFFWLTVWNIPPFKCGSKTVPLLLWTSHACKTLLPFLIGVMYCCFHSCKQHGYFCSFCFLVHHFRFILSRLLPSICWIFYCLPRSWQINISE